MMIRYPPSFAYPDSDETRLSVINIALVRLGIHLSETHDATAMKLHRYACVCRWRPLFRYTRPIDTIHMNATHKEFSIEGSLCASVFRSASALASNACCAASIQH